MFINKIFIRVFGIPISTDNESPDKELNKDSGQLLINQKKSKKIIPIVGIEADKEQKTSLEKEKGIIDIKGHSEDTKDQTPENNVETKATKSVGIIKNYGYAFTLDIEKIPGKGEDAPAILLQFEDDTIILGVADGMGGSGGTVYDIGEGKQSGAYLASRIINTISENYFIDFKKNGLDISKEFFNKIAEELKYHYNNGLTKVLDKIEKKGNIKLNIKSNLIKRLPTTVALSYIKSNNNKITIYNFWAGDSRIYSLDPFTGLHQLTKDDIKSNEDAYDNLYNDSRISNCINADSDYTINANTLEFQTPQIIFSATDGAFGYLQTPVHFEYLLLDSLIASITVEEWRDKLSKKFDNEQSDDISLSLSIIGSKNFVDFKNLFYSRHQLLQKEISNINILFKEVSVINESLKKINESNNVINTKITDFQKKLKDKNKNKDQLERELNSFEYEIKSAENYIEMKRREIIELEKKVNLLKSEINKKSFEFEKLNEEVEAIEKEFKKYKQQNEASDSREISHKLKSLQDTNERLNKELWLKHKAQYEKYLKS